MPTTDNYIKCFPEKALTITIEDHINNRTTRKVILKNSVTFRTTTRTNLRRICHEMIDEFMSIHYN